MNIKIKNFKVFEKWVSNYAGNWASCDTLFNHTVGEFIEMYPGYLPELNSWAKSKRPLDAQYCSSLPDYSHQ
jgi:3-methyladenine DNA glycosylase AlkD